MPRRCALAPLAITHLNVLFPRPPSPSRRPRPVPYPSGQPPTRRPPRRPPPPSLFRALPAVVAVTVAVPSHFLSLIPRFLTTAAVLLSLAFLSFSLAPREAAMTRVNLPQTPDRYRRTSASLSTLLRFFLRPIADNCHPPPPPHRHPPHSTFHPLPLASHGAPCNEPSTNTVR